MTDERDDRDGAGGDAARWCRRLDDAAAWDKEWREGIAEKAEKQYRIEAGKDFAILWSNVVTTRPHLLSAAPVADIRPRDAYLDDDAPRVGAYVVERAVNVALDDASTLAALLAGVTDMLVVGRGVVRLVYEPTFGADGALVDQRVLLRHVPWRRFRHAPAEAWQDVTWVAFQHHMLRREIEAQFGAEAAELVERGGGDELGPDDEATRKARARRIAVWEIWDKEERRVLFVAPSHREQPLQVVSDPLRIEGFFPVAAPLHAAVDGGTLIPRPDLAAYAAQADEMSALSSRIRGLIPAIRYRGIRAADLPELDLAFGARDGEFIAADGALTVAQMTGGGLDRAIWTVPVIELANVVAALSQQREATKQVIYELTGISDIVRGATSPNETLGAQQIKAQYGSARLSERQRQVAAWCRGLVRLMAEIVAEHYTPEVLAGVSGLPLAALAVRPLGQDAARRWLVDIETDSTVQGDVGRLQASIGNFLAGFGQAVGALSPVVQSGMLPPGAAADLLRAFSRPFRLGRAVDEALGQLGAQQQPGAQQPAPEAVAAQQKAVAAQQKAQLDMQAATASHAYRMEELAAESEIARERHAREMAGLRGEIVDGVLPTAREVVTARRNGVPV